MALFGNGFAPRPAQSVDETMRRMMASGRINAQQPDMARPEAPVDPQRLAAISGKKKGLFGNAFRADSPLWHIMGGLGDVITGEPVYTSNVMHQRGLRQKSLMDQAQAEAENAQWYEREKWKRDNPEPRVNDTAADYEFLSQRIGKEAADQYLRNMGDPMVTVPLGDGSFYNGPRSGLGAAIGGGQQMGQPQSALPPGYTKRPKGGPASAPGGFPR